MQNKQDRQNYFCLKEQRRTFIALYQVMVKVSSYSGYSNKISSKSSIKHLRSVYLILCKLYYNNLYISLEHAKNIQAIKIIFHNFLTHSNVRRGLPQQLSGKESVGNVGDVGQIPGSGRSPGRGHGNSPQYSCLQNLMDRGAW